MSDHAPVGGAEFVLHPPCRILAPLWYNRHREMAYSIRMNSRIGLGQCVKVSQPERKLARWPRS